jgi:hypothetical protein
LILGHIFQWEKYVRCEVGNMVLLSGIKLNYQSLNHLELKKSIALQLLAHNERPQEEYSDGVTQSVTTM